MDCVSGRYDSESLSIIIIALMLNTLNSPQTGTASELICSGVKYAYFT